MVVSKPNLAIYSSGLDPIQHLSIEGSEEWGILSGVRSVKISEIPLLRHISSKFEIKYV